MSFLEPGIPLSILVVMWVLGGAFFGLFMAVFASLSMAVTGTNGGRHAFQPVDVHQRRTLFVPLSPADALLAAQDAIRALGVSSVERDDQSLTAKTRITFKSFGEIVTARVEPAAGGSHLHVESRPIISTTMIDYGKSRDNLDKIEATLTKAPDSATAAEPVDARPRNAQPLKQPNA
ncbi:MAG: hypothetical protein AAFV53_11555 [Myxococcota bacterium]